MTLPAAYRWLEAIDPQPRMIAEALKLYGTHEVAGGANSPTILAWAAETGLEHVYTADSIAWCGLFCAVVAKRAGKTVPKDPLWALNWKNFGVDPGQPGLGDVLVFIRPGGGHVGLYVAEDRDAYHVLGGNTSDQVMIARIDKHRLAGARRPIWQTGQPASVKPYIVAAGGSLSTNEA